MSPFTDPESENGKADDPCFLSASEAKPMCDLLDSSGIINTTAYRILTAEPMERI